MYIVQYVCTIQYTVYYILVKLLRSRDFLDLIRGVCQTIISLGLRSNALSFTDTDFPTKLSITDPFDACSYVSCNAGRDRAWKGLCGSIGPPLSLPVLPVVVGVPVEFTSRVLAYLHSCGVVGWPFRVGGFLNQGWVICAIMYVNKILHIFLKTSVVVYPYYTENFTNIL